MKHIYKAPNFRGIVDVILVIPILCIVIYPIFSDGNWKISLGIAAIILLIFLIKENSIIIYEEKIVFKKGFVRKEFLLNNAIFFKNWIAWGGSGYVVEYKEKKERKQVRFYISKKEDVEMLVDFFKSKDVKVKVQIPKS